MSANVDASKETDAKIVSKTAYLLSRCSTAIQAETGESIKRQVAVTQEWINRDFPNWEISNKQFTLSGVSGYDGSSLGLGGFIHAAETQQITPGHSVLVVEAIDRLGRLQPSKMRQLISDLQQKYKIDIAIQKFGLVFYHDAELDLGSDLLITAAIHLARMESEQKSVRIKATFAIRRKQSREGGPKRTSVAPAYLKLNTDRSEFIAIPERAEILKRMFSMKLQGLGPDAIARRFNEESAPTFTNAKNWSRTIIRKYLTSKACIGEFQPQTVSKIDGKRHYEDAGEPITNYYPAVIDEDTFYAVQATFKKATSGRKGNYTNLFKSITRCPICGSTMNILIANRKTHKKTYLKCVSSIRGHGCTAKQIDYQQLEDALVNTLKVLDYSLLGNNTSKSKIQDELDSLRLHREALDERIANELDAIAMASPGIKKRLMDRVNNLDAELSTLVNSMAVLQAELVSISADDSAKDLTLDTYENRAKYNGFIKQYIAMIEPKKDKYRLTFKDTTSVVALYEDDVSEVAQQIHKGDIADGMDGMDYGRLFTDDPQDIWESILTKQIRAAKGEHLFTKAPALTKEEEAARNAEQLAAAEKLIANNKSAPTKAAPKAK